MIKKFKQFNEAIINHRNNEVNLFKDKLPSYLNGDRFDFNDIQKIGKECNIEVVYYDVFYNDLKTEQEKKDAPPKEAGFFALVNPNTHKPRLVFSGISTLRDLRNKKFFDFVIDVLGHEIIHTIQIYKRTGKIEYVLPDL